MSFRITRPTLLASFLFCMHLQMSRSILCLFLSQFSFNSVFPLPAFIFSTHLLSLVSILSNHKLIFIISFFLRKVIKKWHHRARRELRKAVKTQAFYWIVILVVFLNSLTLALEHYDQPEFLTDFLGKTSRSHSKVVL